jgi:acyl carrier protein
MGLDTVELVMAFEQAFGIEIPNQMAEEMVTPRDVRDFVMAEYHRRGKQVDAREIFRKIRDITVEISGIAPEKIDLDSSFVKDLGLN